MTTIAVKGGIMACDSRMAVADRYYVCDDKVIRIGDCLVGAAGDSGDIAQFMAWIKDRGEMPKLEDIDALVLDNKGLWHYTNDCYGTRVVGGCWASGTGGQAAHAAMLCGKTAEEAVKIAIKCDINSGGPVRVYNLKGD
jgi:20S proteasome alpha/beta subunit